MKIVHPCILKTTINRNVVNTSLKKVDVDSIINRERLFLLQKTY
jgi:hypothetical protein